MNQLDQHKSKLLVVEDRFDDVSLLQVHFGDRFEIKVASTISEALQLIDEWRPDIALIDLFVPAEPGQPAKDEKHEPAGLGLIRQINEKHPHIPSIVFTGYVDQVGLQRLIEVGAVEVIDKGSHAAEQLPATLANIDTVLRAREDSLRRIGEAVGATLDDLKRNIDLARSHNARLFKWTLAACIAGFVVFLVGLLLLFWGYVPSGLVASFAGIVPEVVGALFIKRTTEENKRLDLYHEHLLSNQRLLTLIDAANTIEEPAQRDRAKADIIACVLKGMD